MNLFRLDASILPSASASAEIADLAGAEWAGAHPEGAVTRRNLGTSPLPAEAWGLATTAGFTPEGERSREHRDAVELAGALADELHGADALILAVPLYNYGVSQHFKTWVDLVIAGAGTGTPVLKEKPTALVTTLGGGYGPGTPKEGWDHSTGYLTRVLGDLWQADLTVIKRELTLAATTPAMAGLRETAAELHAAAREAAAAAGKSLAGR